MASAGLLPLPRFCEPRKIQGTVKAQRSLRAGGDHHAGTHGKSQPLANTTWEQARGSVLALSTKPALGSGLGPAA